MLEDDHKSVINPKQNAWEEKQERRPWMTRKPFHNKNNRKRSFNDQKKTFKKKKFKK